MFKQIARGILFSALCLSPLIPAQVNAVTAIEYGTLIVQLQAVALAPLTESGLDPADLNLGPTEEVAPGKNRALGAFTDFIVPSMTEADDYFVVSGVSKLVVDLSTPNEFIFKIVLKGSGVSSSGQTLDNFLFRSKVILKGDLVADGQIEYIQVVKYEFPMEAALEPITMRYRYRDIAVSDGGRGVLPVPLILFGSSLSGVTPSP